MLHTLKNYPWIGIALLLLSCIRFEYHTESSSTNIAGLATAIVVLGVVAVVLLFRIFNALHDACVTRGLIPQRLYFRYDVLIPVSILAVMIQGNWVGEALVQGIGGEEVPH